MSVPPRERRGTKHPLRIRLVIVLSALLAAALAATGIASALFMQRNLRDELGNSLSLASDASIFSLLSRAKTAADLRSTGPEDSYYLLGPNSFQLLVDPDGTVITQSYLDSQFRDAQLSASQLRVLTAGANSRDYTSIQSLPGLGDAVVITSPFSLDGVPGDYLLINGSTTSDIDATLREFILTGIVIGLAALAAVSFVGYRAVRTSLAPLERVVGVADEVIATPLSVGAISLPSRQAAPADGRSEAGRVSSALARLLDHVEDALNARHRAEEATQRFIADASHELKNPLAAIRGYSDHYGRAPELSEETRGALARISAEAARMSQLVGDLLQLTKMETSPRLEPVDVDLSRVILETVADAHVAFPEHNWRIDIPEEAVSLISDESAIRQVLLNLTANVGTHTPAGTTAWAGLTVSGDEIVIEIRDDGPGIPPPALAHIFEPFTQNRDSPTQRQRNSVGLGLTIARRLSEWLGGSLVATSSTGRTSFVLSLPRWVE